MILNIICYSLSGFFMKLSDEYMDVSTRKGLAIITGLLCVLFTIIISTRSGDAACIFISILIGTALASKVDSINHILSAIIFILLLILLKVPDFSFFCLICCIIAAFIDEKGNDKYDEKKELNWEFNGNSITIMDKLFEYRFVMKITVLILSVMGLINMFVPALSLPNWIFFEPLTFIYFYLFDLSYELAGVLFNRFNEAF